MSEQGTVTGNFTSYSPVAFVKITEDGSYEGIEIISKAPEGEISKWDYSLNSSKNTISLTNYKGSATDVVVYGSYNINGKDYNTILNSASSYLNNPFYSKRKSITSITIKKGAKSSNLNYMFTGCENVKTIDISGLDTKSVQNMYGVFSGCSKLTSIDLSHFNTSNVTDMSDMFYYCLALSQIDVSSFDTSKVENMVSMFDQCRSIRTLDLTSFDIRNTKYLAVIFQSATSLKTIFVSSNWDITNASKYKYNNGTGISNMFYNCGCSSVIYK